VRVEAFSEFVNNENVVCKEISPEIFALFLVFRFCLLKVNVMLAVAFVTGIVVD
jgi:cell shape-determining protein MreD